MPARFRTNLAARPAQVNKADFALPCFGVGD